MVSRKLAKKLKQIEEARATGAYKYGAKKVRGLTKLEICIALTRWHEVFPHFFGNAALVREWEDYIENSLEGDFMFDNIEALDK